MRIAVLGTGPAGATLGTKLVERGHSVRMGSRDASNPKASAWARTAGPHGSAGTFEDAAKFGELVFNCTAGAASIAALKLAGAPNLDGKVLIDVANALDFSKGMPPGLTVNLSRESLAEQIQAAFPKATVVKALNTVTARLMVNPTLVPGDHQVFVCGNDAASKETAVALIETDFGWKRSNIIDLGDLQGARAAEALILPWVRLWGILGSPLFNWQVLRGPKSV
jgi:8-hydroxy-5-deazaflavin:NADPH oxidoreductase